jgi:hypothetical protein
MSFFEDGAAMAGRTVLKVVKTTLLKASPAERIIPAT